ncbi:MAG: hypothetical protein ACM3QZ_00405 [Solirubrobacterales bacterium]
MRIIGRFPADEQIGAVVDSLRNAGFDRKELIISDMTKTPAWRTVEEATEMGVSLVQTETESIRLGDHAPFWESIDGLRGRTGVLVAVKTPKHDADTVRSILEQSGAVEIVQD